MVTLGKVSKETMRESMQTTIEHVDISKDNLAVNIRSVDQEPVAQEACSRFINNPPTRLINKRMSQNIERRSSQVQNINDISDISKEKDVTNESENSRVIPKVLEAIDPNRIVIAPKK